MSVELLEEQSIAMIKATAIPCIPFMQNLYSQAIIDIMSFCISFFIRKLKMWKKLRLIISLKRYDCITALTNN